MEDLILEARGITKTFPGVKANDHIDIQLRRGEVLAVLGENGAGKTTLMNILYGLYQPDEGEIRLYGKPVRVDSPKAAIDLGIGMIHQHFMLIPNFTVLENIILGMPSPREPLLDLKYAKSKVVELSKKYGLSIDPDAMVWQISVGAQQRVEIIKALYRGAEILILDEPTAVLTPQEAQDLFAVLKTLKAQGKSVIFISHKLDEVMEVSDRVTVLRDGKVIGTVNTRETNTQELARMMVGREVLFKIGKKPACPGTVALELEDVWVLNEKKLPALKGVSLQVRSGEILGIAGVDGNGQTELAEVITGLRRAIKGNVKMFGEDVTNQTPRPLIERGLAHIPADRRRQGLVLDFSIAENMILETYYRHPFARRWILRHDVIRNNAKELIRQYDVRTPGYQVPAKNLSGGNQQKVIIAREFSRAPKILIAVQPTRGLDVGATEYVHRSLLEQRDKGVAILLISTDLEEVRNVSDRLAVIFGGQIMGIVDPATTPIEEIGMMMAGSVGKGPVFSETTAV
ncbi:MAG TPA: ABC transporter ATP-binding protein [Clostridia bacterium]|nr:ABC transporter ATP-binding protein [Clostridia bacterium]